MPNWCSTTITFYSKDRKEIEAMAEKFIEIKNGNPTHANDFGNGWMGDYANTYYPSIGHNKIECRGTVTDITYEPYTQKGDYFYFTIYTETAWGAKVGLWSQIAKDYYPGVEIAYEAEECGNAYYLGYDDTGLFYTSDYIVEYAFVNDKGEYIEADDMKYAFHSVEQIINHLERVLPIEFTHTYDIYKLSEEITQKLEEYGKHIGVDDDFYCNIDAFEKFSPDEFVFSETKPRHEDLVASLCYFPCFELFEEKKNKTEVEPKISWDDMVKGVDTAV